MPISAKASQRSDDSGTAQSAIAKQRKVQEPSPEPEEPQDGGDEGDEEEYEIEAILDAKHGYFPNGRIGYLVKWKGYGPEHNSWVSEDDAGNAGELIGEYWQRNKKAGRKSEVKSASARKRKSEEVSDGEEVVQKKRGRPSKAKTVSDSGKSAKKSKSSAASEDNAMDEDEPEIGNMDKWKNVASWQHLVDHIETVERTQDGRLFVYFMLKQGGTLVREESKICKLKMPQLMLDFYESNLRWRPMEPAD